jgi:hypothetical protein
MELYGFDYMWGPHVISIFLTPLSRAGDVHDGGGGMSRPGQRPWPRDARGVTGYGPQGAGSRAPFLQWRGIRRCEVGVSSGR